MLQVLAVITLAAADPLTPLFQYFVPGVSATPALEAVSGSGDLLGFLLRSINTSSTPLSLTLDSRTAKELDGARWASPLAVCIRPDGRRRRLR